MPAWQEPEGETRIPAPQEEIWYGAYDFTGPTPGALVDSAEEVWLQDLEQYKITEDRTISRTSPGRTGSI